MALYPEPLAVPLTLGKLLSREPISTLELGGGKGASFPVLSAVHV
jgi:hypothetical protein